MEEEFMKGKRFINPLNAAGAVFYLIAIYFLIRSFILSFSMDIWYDELFSVSFAKRSFSEMISLTARDVHPPLYYIILKILTDGLSALGVVGDAPGMIPFEGAAKLVSLLPFVLLVICSLTVIRKRYGFFASGLFAFAMVTMPQLPEYTTEIRMYSWAMLFVTGAFLSGISLLESFVFGSDKWDVKDFLSLTLFSSAAAYTHYYAAFSVGVIYLMLFIRMTAASVSVMKKGGDRPGLKAFALLIISGNFAAISYIPWIGALFSQVSAVKANYWIQPVGIRSLGSSVKYAFKGYFTNNVLGTALCVILFILAAIMVVRAFIRGFFEKDLSSEESIYAFLVMPLIIAAGLIASWLLRPVFVNRYMIPALGCFWLSLSTMLGKELSLFTEKKSRKTAAAAALCMCAVMLITGIRDFTVFIGNEEYRKVNMESTKALLDGIDKDTVVISNFQQVQGLLAYYLQRDRDQYPQVWLYMGEAETLIDEMVPGLCSIRDDIDVHNFLSSGKKVLFLGSFNSREDILKNWNEEYGITSDNEGSFLMERYWFDVFELHE